MTVTHANFCRCCGVALSPAGTPVNRFSPDCAGCRRSKARYAKSQPNARWWHVTALSLGVGLVLAAAFVIILVLIWNAFVSPASLPSTPQLSTARPILSPAPSPIAPAPVSLTPSSAPAAVDPPAVVSDPIRDGWRGAFLLHTRASSASIILNGRTIFLSRRPGTFITPPATLRLDDVVVFEVGAPSEAMRAAFMTADGKQQIALRAIDLRDFGNATTIDAADFASLKSSPAAVGKVSQTEVNAWESSGAHPVPHGSEFVHGPSTDTYRVGFVVTAAMFRPMKTAHLSQRKVFHFDDIAYAKRFWRWKASFKMDADGATDPAEPDNELVSRFELEGDFTVDLDADFGRAAYTNTGGMNVTVCRQEIGFDGGWSFGSWDPCSIRMRVQRLGDEIQLIRDGQVLIVPVPDDQRDQPTNWRLWWRSRDSHIHGIYVSAERIVMPDE